MFGLSIELFMLFKKLSAKDFFTSEEHQSKSKLVKVLQKLTFLDEFAEKQDVRKYRTFRQYKKLYLNHSFLCIFFSLG